MLALDSLLRGVVRMVARGAMAVAPVGLERKTKITPFDWDTIILLAAID